MMTTIYIVSFQYNAGLLGDSKACKTYEEAQAFAADYMENFNDGNKFFSIDRHEIRKVFGLTISHKVTHMGNFEG